MKQPTILQVVPALVTGGVERGTVEMTQAITAAGWNAVVASSGGPMVEEITRAGGMHITLPLKSKNPLTIWRNIARLAEVIEAHHVDIVHARSRAPAWSAWQAARRTGRHFVTTFHNIYGGTSGLKRFYNSVMAKGDRVIAISNFVAAHAQSIYGVPQDILRIIPRGVDVARFNREAVSKERIEKLCHAWGLQARQPVVLLPGRLTRWKGQEIFIEAVARLPRRGVAFVIVGSGDAGYRQELHDAIRRHDLEASVRLVDECRDMPAAFALTDIMVSASTRPEGFGRVIVEAGAMGCVVIATDHGGASETVLQGQTGFLVPSGDAVKLAETLQNVLTMPIEARQAMGAAAIAHVRKNFTTALMTERTLAVYKELGY